MLNELTHMDRITQLQEGIEQLLTIMSSSITYLCSKTSFKQVSEHIPVTRARPAEKFDPPELFETRQRELVTDLIRKGKQIEVLIGSLPVPEPEEEQAKRLQGLQEEMSKANQEYQAAVSRAKNLHAQYSYVLKIMLSDQDPRAMVQA